MDDILSLAQIATGAAAIVSIFYTVSTYRKQKLDGQQTTASNVSSWNAESSPKSLNITLNNNAFPVYNVILTFVPNSSTLEGTQALSEEYQYFYYEMLAPGETSTPFTDNHTPGMGHLVPELFFTDNNNIQWHRNKNGTLEQIDYIDSARKSGIILKHL